MIEEFANRVKEVIANSDMAGFGDLTFISEARNQMGFNEMQDEFAARLLLAHRRGYLRLARADLVPAMDPSLVSDSEITNGSAEFHLIDKRGW